MMKCLHVDVEVRLCELTDEAVVLVVMWCVRVCVMTLLQPCECLL